MSCWSRRVLVGLAVAVLAVLVVAPSSLGKVFPVLMVIACPLGMLVMARSMAGSHSASEGAERESSATTGSSEEELTRLREEVERLRRDPAGEDSGAA